MLKLMLGGQTEMGFGSGEHHPQLDAGKVKVLVALTSQPLSYAPGVFFDPYFYVATGAGTLFAK